ncbi:dTDP-glucose 4,6-dehydratase [Actinomadura rubteroloni]|uniref:dTDP-glucose 4,6-dehydratase n=1 Tax=Actinomadura rubteroloni TaxID=1926885 RepID=A0A2P4UPY5_9ACTN|nr:dTDP-glucose 4,6-dehydratase [Actinomadura rubteroloni]
MLVTGGAGFVGSQYVRDLVSGRYPEWAGARVTVLDALTYAGDLANLAPVDGGYAFVHGDVCDAALLADVVPGHDAVVNFAAESHVDRSIEDASVFVRTNTLGVETLMRACLDAGVPRIVQVSTDEVYGSADDGTAFGEDAPPRPSSPYAAAKAGGDLVALAYARTHGLPVSVTRCGNTYGPYQYPEKLIPLFVTNLLQGRPVPLYGDGRNVRQWTHVEDHARAVQLVAERGEPGAVHHIVGTTSLSNRDLTARLLELCDAPPDMVRYVPDRKGHDLRYRLSGDRLRRLGYAPAVPFERGLAATVRWYADHTDWWKAARYAP